MRQTLDRVQVCHTTEIYINSSLAFGVFYGNKPWGWGLLSTYQGLLQLRNLETLASGFYVCNTVFPRVFVFVVPVKPGPRVVTAPAPVCQPSTLICAGFF